jgi:hypothetical protein
VHRTAISTQKRYTLSIVVGIVLCTLVLRFPGPDAGLTNDHFDRISRGRQIAAYGELPFRDFFDPGYFLTVFSSAALQSVFGRNVIGDVILSMAFLTAGFVMTFIVCLRTSNSYVIAAFATGVAMAFSPRLYNFDKVFFFAAGLLACWTYISAPCQRTVLLMAVVTAVGFLFRHDTLLYLSSAACMTVALIARSGVAGRIKAYAM